LFSAVALRRVESSDAYKFLLSSALLSTYLLFDDFFMVHESLVPKYLGLSETVVFLVLGLAVSSYLIVFRSLILRTNYLLLLLAIGLLAMSVAIDMIPSRWMWLADYQAIVVEDGAKWLGIVSWCSYYSHTSLHFLVGSVSQSNDATQSDART